MGSRQQPEAYMHPSVADVGLEAYPVVVLVSVGRGSGPQLKQQDCKAVHIAGFGHLTGLKHLRGRVIQRTCTQVRPLYYEMKANVL